MRRHTEAHAKRKHRRKWLLIILISLVFVILGAFIWLDGDTGTGLIAMLFFGGGVIVGVAELAGSQSRIFGILMSIGALGLGAASTYIFLTGLAGEDLSSSTRSHTTMMIASGLGTLLFGLGGIALLISTILGMMRPRDAETDE
ncbi:MAG: hypothetical protein ACTHXA_04245 [Gulosibacter sp.]|uniref:hypothetical protein n=1 Tax=Gulosibacter sp. TaxID=2817531 RepID=UPI003F8E9A46